MIRYLPTLLVLVLVLWLAGATRTPADAQTQPPGPDEKAPPPPVFGATLEAATPLNSVIVSALRTKLRREHRRYLAAHRRVRQLTRVLHHATSTHEAITLACLVYGSCTTLWRRADCESGLYPRARNASGASGLFQFLPSTWRSTPFASMSIWSPYAQSLAAGWMQTHGRGGEWSCR